MKSIAIFNNKGGVGKTTLLCNLAAYFSKVLHKKVLVVDADPQCNATQSMFANEVINDIYLKDKFSIYSIVKPLAAGKGFTKELQPLHSEAFGVDVIPGDPALALTEDLLATDWSQAISGSTRGLRTTFLFSNLLSKCKDYDYVIFDMGPSLGSINRAVLISSDFFITPMSIDIFSLKAIENISLSLVNWRKRLDSALSLNEEHDEIEIENLNWNLKFAGYVTQQYTAKKDEEGKLRPVKAFDKIIKKIPSLIKKELIDKLQPNHKDLEYSLGSIPTLHSLIPLSQSSRQPIFNLRASDGVVGAHFTKVKEYKEIMKSISSKLMINIETLS